MLARLPGWMLAGLARFGVLPAPNLRGDRAVEWSWVAAHLGHGPGQVLDFGSGGSLLGLVAARRGYQVTAIDVHPVRWWHEHPQLKTERVDVLSYGAHAPAFDLIINCSTIEHVGLAGRYGVAQPQPDADLNAMAALKRLLKPSGTMVLTLPVGRDAVFPPLHRVYGAQRLPRLLSGWRAERQEYWVKDAQNRWVMAPSDTALSRQPSAWCYGLGLFILRPDVAHNGHAQQ